MRKLLRTGVAATMAVSLSGCAETTGSIQSRPTVAAAASIAPAASAVSGRAPSYVSPIAALQPREEVIVAFVPQAGFVRGTRSAIASFGTPLQPAPGLNRTVEACRDVVKAEAEKLGAREVEAASAGPDRRNEKGQFVGPVRVRITYVGATGYEVREANMTCVVDQYGKIVDAFA